jgi:hypothetical protein
LGSNAATRSLSRLSLLAGALLFTLFTILLARSGDAQDSLHILPPDSIERLRLDFNASRDKVRLVFMLSPT